jgi:hypothetical protein
VAHILEVAGWINRIGQRRDGFRDDNTYNTKEFKRVAGLRPEDW